MIKKALVVIGGAPMNSYTSMRAIWAIQDWCRAPGPMQVPPGPGPALHAAWCEPHESAQLRQRSAGP